jgi:hypothetical protein
MHFVTSAGKGSPSELETGTTHSVLREFLKSG